MLEKREYYVYAHYRKTTGKIFYVGISKTENRIYDKYDRNDIWKKIVKKHGFTYKKLKTDLTFKEACDQEILLIYILGRIKYGGLLANLTEGGEGTKGISNRNISLETKEKMSKVHRGIPVLQYDLEGNFIREWEYIRAVQLSGIFGDRKISPVIHECCSGKNNRKSALGFQWKFKLEENFPLKIESYNTKYDNTKRGKSSFYILNKLTGETYRSLGEATRKTGSTVTSDRIGIKGRKLEYLEKIYA